MLSILKLYLEASRGLRRRAGIVVLLKGLASLLEAIGLVWLLQLVGDAFTAGMPGHGQVEGVEKILGYFGWNHFRSTDGIWGVTALGVMTVALRFFSETMLSRIVAQAEERVRRRHARAVARIEWPYFMKTRLGASNEILLARGAQAGFAVNSFVYFASETMGAVLCFAMAFFVAPTMTIFIGGFFLIVSLAMRQVGRELERHFQDLPQSARVIGEMATEFLNHLKFLRSIGRSDWAIARLDGAFASFSRASFYLHLSRSIPMAFVELMGVAFIALTFLAGLKFAWFPLAEGITFLALFYRLAPRVQMALSHYAQMRARKPLIADLMHQTKSLESAKTEVSGDIEATFRDVVRFKRVSFAYRSEAASFSLDEISLQIHPGKCLALVGESGAGKSTVLDLLTGLLRPESGEVEVDGVDLRRIDLVSWRRHIGLVSQEIPVFEGTLLENLLWDSLTPDLAAATRALRQAGLWEFVAALPHGLQTQVGPGGLRLSGGQRQRLALARALCAEPSLLILDEATSSLDSSTELLLQDELKRIKGTVAMLMIAHRLKTVEMADEILVFHGGRIVERGTWGELLALPGGRFARMAREQGISIKEISINGEKVIADRAGGVEGFHVAPRIADPSVPQLPA